MSDPREELALQAVETTIGTIIRTANGYYGDLLADDVLDLKKDLETDGSGLRRAQVYSAGFDNRQQGDEAAMSQTLKTLNCFIDACVAVQSDCRRETARFRADLERALMKDISQGGVCLNTFVTGAELFGVSPNNWGHFTLSFQLLIRHAVNDPSQEYQVEYN